jgi:hypothetical protein
MAERTWRARRFPPSDAAWALVGHRRHRAFEPRALRERPNERQEVGQLAHELCLAAATQRAQVLGREDVADEGERQGEEECEREQRGQGKADSEDRKAEDELGGIDLGRRERRRIGPGRTMSRSLTCDARAGIADPIATPAGGAAPTTAARRRRVAHTVRATERSPGPRRAWAEAGTARARR